MNSPASRRPPGSFSETSLILANTTPGRAIPATIEISAHGTRHGPHLAARKGENHHRNGRNATDVYEQRDVPNVYEEHDANDDATVVHDAARRHDEAVTIVDTDVRADAGRTRPRPPRRAGRASSKARWAILGHRYSPRPAKPGPGDNGSTARPRRDPPAHTQRAEPGSRICSTTNRRLSIYPRAGGSFTPGERSQEDRTHGPP